MSSNRQDASGWFYERANLLGFEIWGTGAVLNHDTVPQELHCYDLYTIGDENNENDIYIAKKPIEGEKIGAVLSAEPLPFQQDSLNIRGIECFENEPMQTLEDIVKSMQQSQQSGGLQMQIM